MSIIALGNIPAGYECESARLIQGNVVTTKWFALGGRVIYAHAVLTYPGEEKSEKFWENMIAVLLLYVRSRDLNLVTYENGVATFKGVALSDKPPVNLTENDDARQAPQYLEGRPRPDGGYDLSPLRPAAGHGGGQ